MSLGMTRGERRSRREWLARIVRRGATPLLTFSLGLSVGVHALGGLQEPEIARQSGNDTLADVATPQGMDVNGAPAVLAAPVGELEMKPEAELSRQEIARRALSWAVSIHGDGVYGSGFLVDPRGYIITNDHVVSGMKNIWVSFSDGQPVRAELIDKDPTLDLALLKVAVARESVASVGSIAQLEVGEEVMTVGSPRKMDFTVSRGIVSYVGRKVKNHLYLQSDLPTNSGNSGGPIVNRRGEVVAVMTFILKNSQGLAFGVPIEYAFERFASHLEPQRADLASFKSWRESRQAL